MTRKLVVHDSDEGSFYTLNPSDATGVPIPAFKYGAVRPPVASTEGEAFIDTNTGVASVWNGAAWTEIAVPVIVPYPDDATLLAATPNDGQVAMSQATGNVYTRVNSNWLPLGLRVFPTMAGLQSTTPADGSVAFAIDSGEFAVRAGGAWAALSNQGVTVGDTAPATPLAGHQWYEITGETLWIYDGANWVPISIKHEVFDTYALMAAAVKPDGAIVFCKELPFAGTYVADAAAADGFRRLSNRTSFTYTTPSAFADAADQRRVLIKNLSPNATSYRITVRDTADDGSIYEFVLSVSLYRNPDIHPHIVNAHNSKIQWLGQTYNGTDGLKIVAQFDADATDKTYEIFVEADGTDLSKATSPAALVETDEPSLSHKVDGKKDFPDDVQRRLTAGRAGNPAEVLAWTGGSLGNSQDGHNILLEYGKLHKFSGFLINRGGTSMPLLSITKNVNANDKVDVSNALNSHCMNLDIDSNTLGKFTLVHSLGFTNIWTNSWGVTQNKAICMDITVDMRDPNYWTFKFEAMGHASDGHYIKSEGQIIFRNDATGYGFYFTHTGSQTVDWRMFRDH